MIIPYWSYGTINLGLLIVDTCTFFTAAGLLFGFLLFLYLSRKMRLRRLAIFYLGIFGLTGGLIGAKIGGVILNFEAYSNITWFNRLNLFQGPSFSFTGIIGLFIIGALYIWYLNKYTNEKINFWQIADIATFSVILFLIIFRIGCFLLNDHMGVETNLSWGILWFDGVIRHPIILYFIFSNIAILLLLIIFYKKFKIGQSFLIGLFCYAVSRFLLSFFQAEEKFAGLSIVRYFSIIFLITTLALFVIYVKKRKFECFYPSADNLGN